jgi:Protein of unknown function (DUF3551)
VQAYAQQVYGIPPEQVVGTAATHAMTRNKTMGLAFSARGQWEVAMRILLFIVGVFVTILFIEKPAEAQNYPWCAEYGGTPSGPTNCGFVTFQQCLDTVSGIGAAELAGSASEIICISLRLDRIHQRRRSEHALHIERRNGPATACEVAQGNLCLSEAADVCF